ncbi:hypothetical protein [Burkholderia cenocepacia]
MKNELNAPTHLFATVGALTERGGRVTTATSGLTWLDWKSLASAT